MPALRLHVLWKNQACDPALMAYAILEAQPLTKHSWHTCYGKFTPIIQHSLRMYYTKHKLKTCAACNVEDHSCNQMLMAHILWETHSCNPELSTCTMGGAHSYNTVLMVHCNSWGSLGEENLQNESVLWEVDVYKLSVNAHILRKCMSINQFSL